jgi:hypothetical protein
VEAVKNKSDILHLPEISQAVDLKIVQGVVCPFRSQSFPIPQPGGQIGFIECLAPCRRDCGIFDEATQGCSVKATGRPPLGLV